MKHLKAINNKAQQLEQAAAEGYEGTDCASLVERLHDAAGQPRHPVAVVEGDGMRLSVDGAQPVERRRLEPAFAFPGEAPVWCEPTAGPIRDVNLMLDRASATGALTLLAGQARHRAAGDVLLVHALAGTLTVIPDGGEALTVPAGHSLLLRDTAVLVEAPDGAEGVCAEVRRR